MQIVNARRVTVKTRTHKNCQIYMEKPLTPNEAAVGLKPRFAVLTQSPSLRDENTKDDNRPPPDKRTRG